MRDLYADEGRGKFTIYWVIDFSSCVLFSSACFGHKAMPSVGPRLPTLPPDSDISPSYCMNRALSSPAHSSTANSISPLPIPTLLLLPLQTITTLPTMSSPAPTLTTPLTTLLSITHPILLAGMVRILRVHILSLEADPQVHRHVSGAPTPHARSDARRTPSNKQN